MVCPAKRFLFFALLIIFGAKPNTCNTKFNYRLNKNIIPESYDIKIKPYLFDEDISNEFTFDGEVNITLYTKELNVEIITLQKDLLEINKASLFGTNALILLQEFNTSELVYEYETNKLSLILKESLIVNERYTLYFSYNGQIRNDVAGIFRTSYVDINAKTRWIVLTQAQRIDARSIFPCWDEPAFKAKFRMKISRPKNYISVFNTRLVDSKIDDLDSESYLDTFNWTPTMSTYLIAFMISQYEKRGNENVVIYSRPEYNDYTTFSYEITEKALEAYNNLTKIPYQQLGNAIFQSASSPKFPHNGMENWGLILYRDPVLIHEPNYSDGWKNKQYTITIVIHETAHMWFGNSVTFEWWSYFWLNEAFARYYQFFLANEIYPEFQLDQQFVVNQMHSIFIRDALNTTLPLSSPEDIIETPAQIATMFSSVAYAKGASFVRMLRNLMGYEKFDKAINEYLTEFHLKNTRPQDLFKHLKRNWPLEYQVDLDEFFKDWSEKVGYPMLMVKVSKDRRQVAVRQQRFLLSPNDGSDSNLRYTIPLTYTTNLENNFDNFVPKAFLNSSMDTLNVQVEHPFDWIIFNVQQSNYYRVLYDLETLNRIKKALESPFHSHVHVINRAQLIDDLLNFARAGILNYVAAFKFLEYLVYEKEYLPWQAALTSLSMISERLTMEQQDNFGKFLHDIASNVYHKLGFEMENDTVLDVYNRNNMVYWLCKYENADCNRRAQLMLLEANRTGKWISPDFRETVYCSAIRFGEFRYYSIVDQLLAIENRSSEKGILLRSLGCTLHFAEYHFARILTDQIPQEYKRLTLKPLYAENPKNFAQVLFIILNSYNRLADQLGGYPEMADVICDISNYITTRKEQQLLDEFILEHGAEFGVSIKTLQNAAKITENNLIWSQKHLGELNGYLKSRNGTFSFNFSLLLMVLGIIFLRFCS